MKKNEQSFFKNENLNVSASDIEIQN